MENLLFPRSWFRLRHSGTHLGFAWALIVAASSSPIAAASSPEWLVYPEPGTYFRPVTLRGTNDEVATVRIPADASGQTIHVLLAVTDSGQPPLTRYRRAVINVGKPTPEQLLTPFFHPPAEFMNQFGSYRSTLNFNDGAPVRTPADWARRREEILNQWHDLMGPWPPLITEPKVEFLPMAGPASLQLTNRSAPETNATQTTARAGELPARPERDNFARRPVRLEIGPGQTGKGWLLVPEGKGRFPAVLVLYYEPETSVGLGQEPLRDFGLQLARRGFVTLSIGAPGGNAWKPEIGLAQCQPLSYDAYVAANCWRALANLPQVDSTRIGVVGHSYGGKWAMFAGALWDKFAAVAVSDPGIVFDETRPNVNYWEPWYLGLDANEKRPKAGLPTAGNPRTGAYKHMIETGRDLHELHALIAPRPFLVSGGSEDPPERWLALNRLEEVNRLLGVTNHVALTRRPAHMPTAESNEEIYSFFELFLKNKPPIPTSN